MAIQNIKFSNWMSVKLIAWSSSIFFILFFFLWISVHEGYSQERVTNEELHRTIANSVPHRIMLKQRKRLQAVLDGFLTGDSTLIQNNLREIMQDMDEVSNTYPPPAGKEGEEWKALAEVMNHSKQAETSISKGDYLAAYTHFSRVTLQCMQCHQSQRSWGVFPELAKEEEKTPQKPAEQVKVGEVKAQ